MKPLLDITDVSLSYHSLSGETPALSHISFQLMPGEFLAIVGPSGCGKSTLLNLICGLLRPEQGQILLDGTPVTSGDCRIGYMLQKDHLLEWRTIYKNVLLGLEIRRELTAEKLAYVNQLLSDYGLDKFRSAHPSELSGGMRQRAALIRTLALKPELLLLDEPFSALDSQTRLSVSDDIGRILHQEKRLRSLSPMIFQKRSAWQTGLSFFLQGLPLFVRLCQFVLIWRTVLLWLPEMRLNLNLISILSGRS